MIKVYVADIASQMGLKLTKVSLTGGLTVACLDYRLKLVSESHEVSTIIYQSELDSIEKSSCSGFLELKIRAALERLSMQLTR